MPISTRRPRLQPRSVAEAATVCVLLLLGAACSSEIPTIAEHPTSPGLPALAPPPSCPAQINLVITMAEGPGGTEAIRGDVVSNIYAHGTAGVSAHTSGANGNLALSVQNAPTRRYSWTASSASGLSNDRLYTNSHTNPGGNNACGLSGMANGSTGSAAFEAELLAGPTNVDIIRYGKACNGSAASATRVTTTRSSDGNSWTITGSSGVYCTKSGKTLTQSGTTGAFSMTLVRQ